MAATAATAEMAEKFSAGAMVKGTMLRAHLDWALRHLGEASSDWPSPLSPEAARLVGRTVLSTDWIPFRLLIDIDRAIAAAAVAIPCTEDSEAPWPAPGAVFRDLGRHSAALNLGGVYRSFVSSEPHRFFERTSVLHHQFQNFGRSTYERTGERSGLIRIEGYTSYSPVFCTAGAGYFEEALHLMHVPGRAQVVEPSCHCRGDSACVFEARL